MINLEKIKYEKCQPFKKTCPCTILPPLFFNFPDSPPPPHGGGNHYPKLWHTSEQVRKKCWQRYQKGLCHRSCSTYQSCVQRLQNPRNFEKVYYFVYKFQTTYNTKFMLFYNCCTYENIFCLFDASANKTKVFNLKVNCEELRLARADLRQKDSLQNKS